MMVRIKFQIISNPGDINKNDWEEFVLRHPNGNPFQTPQMFDFLNNVDNYDAHITVCQDMHGKILGVLSGIIQKEKGWMSGFTRRCIVWGGPLIINSDQEILSALLMEFINQVKTISIYIELRNLFSLNKFRDNFGFMGFNYHDHMNYLVTTDTLENVKKRLSSSKWRQIKKGLKQGVEIIEANNVNQVVQFYEILKTLYTKKVKKPLPPKAFFENFFFNKSLGKYLLLKYNQRIIGGIMCNIYKNTIYEWYIAGLDHEYKDLYPGVLATWAPIQYALDNQLKYFDFLGAGSPDSDYGVREFKSKFGGELLNYGRYIRINKPILYRIGKMGLKLYQKFN